MKKILTFLTLLITISYSSFAQKLNPAELIYSEGYLLKSKKQQTMSLAIGIPGAALGTIGMIIYMSEFDNGLPGGTNYNGNKSKTGELLMYVGGAAALAGGIFRIASKINKRKAMSISFENQNLPHLVQNAIVSNLKPSVILRVKL